jgi:hypothetical protein
MQHDCDDNLSLMCMAHFLAPPHRAGSGGLRRAGAGASQAGRSVPTADWRARPKQSSLARRRHALLSLAPVGRALGGGLRHSARLRRPCAPLRAPFVDRRRGLPATGFPAKTGEPANRQSCQRGPWKGRRLVATGLSKLTTVCQTKQRHHRVWEYFWARVAWPTAAGNILAQGGRARADNDMVRLSIAEFSL